MDTIYLARCHGNKRIVATSDKDCLPPDTVGVFEATSTADLTVRADRSERFWHLYERMRWLENIGYEIKIDLGSHYYETGDNEPTIL